MRVFVFQDVYAGAQECQGSGLSGRGGSVCQGCEPVCQAMPESVCVAMLVYVSVCERERGHVGVCVCV